MSSCTPAYTLLKKISNTKINNCTKHVSFIYSDLTHTLWTIINILTCEWKRKVGLKILVPSFKTTMQVNRKEMHEQTGWQWVTPKLIQWILNKEIYLPPLLKDVLTTLNVLGVYCIIIRGLCTILCIRVSVFYLFCFCLGSLVYFTLPGFSGREASWLYIGVWCSWSLVERSGW